MPTRASKPSAAPSKPPADVTTPVMGSYDGIFVNSYRYAPFSPDRLTAQKGFDAADDMMTYAACRANFNLKRYAVLAQGWQIIPAVTDPGNMRHAQAKAYADFVTWCLNNIVSVSGVIPGFPGRFVRAAAGRVGRLQSERDRVSLSGRGAVPGGYWATTAFTPSPPNR